ncbi:hypothetical protein ACB092_03G007300 [Castanea dentata]
MKSPSDPSIGSFSSVVQPQHPPQAFVWKDGSPFWRSGPWSGRTFTGMQELNHVFQNGLSFVEDQDGTFVLSFFYVNMSLSHIVLTTQGDMELRYWDNEKEDWKFLWKALKSECHFYGKCGEFGSCYSRNSPICSCLRGFKPNDTKEWNRGNWTSGCVRTPLQCGKVNSTGSEDGKMDGFLKLKMMKVPDFAEWSAALEDDCRQQCLQNCSRNIRLKPCGWRLFVMSLEGEEYLQLQAIGIATPHGPHPFLHFVILNLIDTNQWSSSGVDLYIRLAYLELDTEGDLKKIVTITVVIGTVFISICGFILWRCIAKHKARKKKAKGILLLKRWEAHKTFRNENMLGENLNQIKVQELPLINFEKLASATNNFHQSNKIGQGGFGPVYRGILSNGQEIAVKGLSKTSGQGLQHRNLVRLHGRCVEGEERTLIYEYMPNKSLDAFLFDPQKENPLDWRKHFNIIQGIGRGLLYLHRDSRLRIIHRDLKTSNILLDKELHPKISDFGMARIFRGNEDQANTIRVVGTYGYMSPEYAIKGLFSEKSNVFSFGVVLLEILSGRKNTSIYNDEQSLSLLGLAWKLWNADNIVALIDPMIYEPCFEMEILRCIQVKLLCVQEFAKDRPTVSVVVSMLKSEIVDLPLPKKSAFTERNIALDIESSQLSQSKCSANNVTITMVQGR